MCGKHEHWFNRSHRRLRLRRGGILRVEKRLQKHGYAGRIYILDTNEFTDEGLYGQAEENVQVMAETGDSQGDTVSAVLTHPRVAWHTGDHVLTNTDDHLR